MPVSKYFQGHGSEVMSQMKKKHGSKVGKREFYATANKLGMAPTDGAKKKMGVK